MNTTRHTRAKVLSGNNYAFIDAQNLNLGTKKMGWKLNWRKFRDMLEGQYGVSKAFLFIGYMPENEDLYKQMQESGYVVVLKPTMAMYSREPQAATNVTHSDNTDSKSDSDKTAPEEHKKPETKGNVDAEMVLWAVKEIPHYNQAIIVSGDGDFFSLVEYLHNQKKLKHIMTPNWMYSTLLKTFEPQIVRIDTKRRLLEYRDRRPGKPKTA